VPAAVPRPGADLTHRPPIKLAFVVGRCGEGPALVVYPDGVWYRSVRAEDAADIVQEHIVGDRLVARIVDHVMH
jgi:(2Fe-2S) ferredoxin